MRRMPTSVSSVPFTEREWHALDLPVAMHYHRAVLCLVGRELTPAEQERLERMANHQWTVRAAAEDLLGRDLTHDEFEARKATDPEAFAVKPQ